MEGNWGVGGDWRRWVTSWQCPSTNVSLSKLEIASGVIRHHDINKSHSCGSGCFLSKESTLNIHWKDCCWSWSSNTLVTWCKEPTHWKRPWCWERWKEKEKGSTQDEMVRQHHWLNGGDFEQTSGEWTEKPGMLQSMLCSVTQSCPTLFDPVDYSPPGSSVLGDSPGKNTGVGCHAVPAGIEPRDRTQVSCISGRFFTIWATREAHEHWSG